MDQWMESHSALRVEHRAEKRRDQLMERWIEGLWSLIEYHLKDGKISGQEHRECH